MTTENTKTTGNNFDPRLQHFVTLAKGLHDVGRGRVLTDTGRARIVVGMIMAAKAVHADEDSYNALIRASAGIHADPKNAKNAFTEAWGYWRDNMNVVRSDMPELKRVKPDDVRIDRHYAPDKGEDDLGSEGRNEANAPVSARTNGLMFAASVLIQFDACKVDWNIVQAFKEETILIDEANANRLFEHAKKDKTIARIAKRQPHLAIGTYGDLRFTALAELGNAELRRRGVKKIVTPRKTGDTSAMRDRLSLIVGDLDKADAKSYDASPDENLVLKTFIGAANALNDGTLKGMRFNRTAYSVIDWIVEGAAAECEGKPVPSQYKAIMDFASDLLDKNIAKENGKPRKAA